MRKRKYKIRKEKELSDAPLFLRRHVPHEGKVLPFEALKERGAAPQVQSAVELNTSSAESHKIPNISI